MKANIKHTNICGIYLIENLINGKVYIGKSTNIHRRIRSHISQLNGKHKKSENQHFINSWHKYGRENFDYRILEECDFSKLKERELYWMNYYKSTNPEKGYNKRLDSEGGMIPHDETKKKLSNAQIRRWSCKKARLKNGERTSEFWKNNPNVKEKMAEKVKKKKQKYRFIQMLEDNTIIHVYESMDEVIHENPTYKWQNIYCVCNGYKKRIYGYKWKKELKI